MYNGKKEKGGNNNHNIKCDVKFIIYKKKNSHT
jgi:hypothetical protein